MGYVNNLTEYEKRISEAAKNFAFDMSEQTSALQNVSYEISHTSEENLSVLIEKAEAYNETLAQTAQQQVSYMEAVCQQLSESCAGSMALLAKNASDSNMELVNSAKQQMKMMMQVSDGVSSEFNKASNALAHSASELNRSLDTSLNSAVQQFEYELSLASQNFGKTVNKIDIVTKSMPDVVTNAYKTMYQMCKGLSDEIELMGMEMRKMTMGMQMVIDSMDVLQAKINNSQNGNSSSGF